MPENYMAAILAAPGRVEFEERTLGRLSDTSVRVKTMQSALCGSDVDKWRGRDPNLPNRTGHELAGEIVEIGRDVTTRRVGEQVAVWTVAGGGMAEYVDAWERYCRPVAPDVAFASSTEPLACVVNAFAEARHRPGDDILVVGGTGFMGRMAVQLCAMASPRNLIVAGRRPDALSEARTLGATRTVNLASENLEEIVSGVTDGQGVDVAYEFVGTADGLRLAGRNTRPGRHDRRPGRLIVGGYHQGDAELTEWGEWNGRGLKICNAHWRPDWECLDGMDRAARLLEMDYGVDPGPFTPFSLEQIEQAFRVADERPPGFNKAVVVFN